jgi:hypothetical protein
VDGSRQPRLMMTAARCAERQRHGRSSILVAWRATTNLSQQGLTLWGRHRMANSPKGILGSGSDRSSTRGGEHFFLKLGDCESVLWWSSSLSKTTSSFTLVSSSSSLASIAARGGRNQCVIVAAKAKAVAQFGSKIHTI